MVASMKSSSNSTTKKGSTVPHQAPNVIGREPSSPIRKRKNEEGKDAANSQPRKPAGNREAFQNPSRLIHSDLNSSQGRTTCGLNLGKFTQSTVTLTFFTEAQVCEC